MSPHRAFAELLRSSLEESGRYQVRLAHTAKEALAAAKEMQFDLAVLDSDVEDEPISSAGRQLTTLLPDLMVMVIPPDNDPTHLTLVNFTPHSFLERPFYLPDLLTRLDRLLGFEETREPFLAEKPEGSPLPGGVGLPEWLHDERQIACDLEILLRETYFSNALLVQGDRVVGTSVQLDRRDAHSAAGWIGKHWDQSNDMARFIRMEARGGEHLLYVTRLSGALALATVSDVSLPLTQVRAGTRNLAKNLIEMIAHRERETEEQKRLNEIAAIRQAAPAAPEMGGAPPLTKTARQPEGEEEDSEDTDSGLLIKLSDLLEEMPPPDPASVITPSEWEAAAPDDTHELKPPADISSRKNGSSPLLPDLVLPWEEEAADAQSQTTPLSTSPAPAAHQAHRMEDQIEEPEATMPVFVQISFTCILIPANPYHHLVGELAKNLNRSLPQICLGLGWQLQAMDVEPERLLWAVEVTPTVSPGHIIRMVRMHTSKQIFSQFPDLLEENMAGDFWAPGYLVISGSQPPTEQLVRDFISQTRRRQGIS